MPWRTITADSVLAEFVPAEAAMLQATQNSLTGLSSTLTDVIKEYVGALAAVGKPVTNDGSVPDQLRRHIIAKAKWTWLRQFPKLPAFKTKERADAAAEADRIYAQLCNNTFGAVEAPYGTDITTGNWNSQPKLIMRTMPTPQPSVQFQQTPTLSPLYANPNAQDDFVETNSPGVPQTPQNFSAAANNAAVVLTWLPALNAATYNIYRGTSPGGELATPIATGISGTDYKDSGLTNGVTYYYQVSAVNGAMESNLSLEASATPLATIL
jgi:hypothetical protein